MFPGVFLSRQTLLTGVTVSNLSDPLSIPFLFQLEGDDLLVRRPSFLDFRVRVEDVYRGTRHALGFRFFSSRLATNSRDGHGVFFSAMAVTLRRPLFHLSAAGPPVVALPFVPSPVLKVSYFSLVGISPP